MGRINNDSQSVAQDANKRNNERRKKWHIELTCLIRGGHGECDFHQFGRFAMYDDVRAIGTGGIITTYDSP